MPDKSGRFTGWPDGGHVDVAESQSENELARRDPAWLARRRSAWDLFELSHRTLFKGLIWIADRGFPNVQTWSTMEALVTCSDITVFLLPVVMPWTFLLILLRMRSAAAELAANLAAAGDGGLLGRGFCLAMDRRWRCSWP